MMDLKGAHIQKWDGKKETFDRFEAQVVAVATILDCEDLETAYVLKHSVHADASLSNM